MSDCDRPLRRLRRACLAAFSSCWVSGGEAVSARYRHAMSRRHRAERPGFPALMYSYAWK